MRAGQLRLLLLLDVVAIGATAAALVLGVGLPLAARGGLGPVQLVALAIGVALGVGVVGGALLVRSVGRPVDRILNAADALGAAARGELPLLAPPGEAHERGLSRAAVAFERVAAALSGERVRLAEKVAELERANAELVSARESLLRVERLATVGTLAAGIAHEVGNPLGAITGYVELARDRLRVRAEGQPAEAAPERAGGREPSDASRVSPRQGVSPRQEADDFLVRIGAEATRIDTIVRELLEFARPVAPTLGPTGLRAAVDDAVRLARVQTRFRDVEVEVDLDAAPERVLGEERRLSQVILNLLLNAADAMGGRGRVRVSARSMAAREGAARVELRVADTGPGIAPADLARLFEPFFTTKAPGQGTGLGLAVCHGIVSSFGGCISAENLSGGGAAFRLELRPWPKDGA